MFWYDGQLYSGTKLELDINEPGLLYGATLFTTLRVYENSLEHPLTNWPAHCQRLQKNIASFGWPEPDWLKLKQGAEHLLPHFPVLRLVVFPDGREWITGRNLPTDLDSKQKQGITAWLAEEKSSRTLPQQKTGNYLLPWLTLQKAKKINAQEAILTNHNNNWLESATGNLWGWREDCWYTTPVEAGILPGITRSQLLNYLHQQKIRVEIIPWSSAWSKTLTVLAYSNCAVEIIPIHTVITTEGQLKFNPNHPILEQLRYFFVNTGK